MWQIGVIVLLSLLGQAFGYCELCVLNEVHDEETTSASNPLKNAEDLPYCQHYKDFACCSPDVVKGLLELYGEEYLFDRCHQDPAINCQMSEKCREFFINEACFYECDVNVGKYRKHVDCDPNGWSIEKMPLKASYCDAFYDACADDYFCSCVEEDGCTSKFSAFEISRLTCNLESGRCNTFADTFINGKEMCEKIWDGAFIYEEDEDQGYVWSWDADEPNPNNKINLHVGFPDPCPDSGFPLRDEVCGEEALSHPEIIPHSCHLCQVRNEHDTGTSTKTASTTEKGELGMCQAWDEYSCCSPEVAETIDNGMLYGYDYRWERCYDNSTRKPSDRCSRWFKAEECLYECDVSVGKFRKHRTCDENSWQIEGMPLKASECDTFFRDCENELVCTCIDEEECAQFGSDGQVPAPRSYFALPAVECTEGTCRTFGEVYRDGKDLCETMWEGAFVYERHENVAYSLNVGQDAGSNRNNLVNTHIEFSPNCPDFQADEEEACLGESTNENQNLEASTDTTNENVEASTGTNEAPAEGTRGMWAAWGMAVAALLTLMFTQ